MGTLTALAIVKVLSTHILYGIPDDGDAYECACGWTPSETAWEEPYGEDQEHREHLAAALIEATS